MAEICKICEKRIPWGQKFRTADGFVCGSCLDRLGISSTLGKKGAPKLQKMTAVEIVDFGEELKAKREAEREAARLKPVFTATRKVDGILLVDDANRLIRIRGMYSGRGWSEYRFGQIVGYEVSENGQSIRKTGGLGGFLAGGMLFGTAGAIVGGLSESHREAVVEMAFVILLKDADWKYDAIILHSASNGELKRGTDPYFFCLKLQEGLSDVFNDILEQNVGKAEEGDDTLPAPSVADEILKLKELLDSGVLSEDEFAAAKRKLLGL